MGKYETALLWVILILSGILYSWTKKKRNEALMREMTGDTTPPPKDTRDNFLFEGLIAGVFTGWLVGYLGLADKTVSMSFGVIAGFCAGLVIKKPKKKENEETAAEPADNEEKGS